MKSMDYIWQQVMFRELELNPDGEGWMFCLGLG